MNKNSSFGQLTIEELPPPTQFLGDLSVVLVRGHLHNLPSLQLGPHHERVHRPLDVVRGMFLGLNKKRKKKIIPLQLFS